MSHRSINELNKLIIPNIIEFQQLERDVSEFMVVAMEELETEKVQKYVGSVPGHKVVHRNRIEAHQRLIRHYFSRPDSTFDEQKFRRRFRMSIRLFNRIMEDILKNDKSFEQKRDAAGKSGFSPIVKITAALRQLAYGYAADCVDEYLEVSESSALFWLKKFCQVIIDIYEEEYMRSPNADDVERLLEENAKRGFPGMLGSIDCMHWVWKNCPTAWHGQYMGKEGVPTIVLEAVASKDLWIWHAFFGLPGSLNDLNILNASPVFNKVVEGVAPKVEFEIRGNKYRFGYYLADGIYPKYATLVKTIACPSLPKEKVFLQFFFFFLLIINSS